jgi:hypothetical protein
MNPSRFCVLNSEDAHGSAYQLAAGPRQAESLPRQKETGTHIATPAEWPYPLASTDEMVVNALMVLYQEALELQQAPLHAPNEAA